MSAPPNSPPTFHDEQLPVVVATITSSGGDFQCCLCLHIGSDSNLRAECFHRFCRTCFNIGETVRELNLDKCPACLKDLDETISEVLGTCSTSVWQLIMNKANVNTDEVVSVVAEHHHMKENTKNTKAKETEMAPANSSVMKRKIHKRVSFDNRRVQLLEFKEEFGHCNVPQRYGANPTLGRWCSNMRSAHKIKRRENKQGTSSGLSKHHIEQLEAMGFKWKGVDHDLGFDKRCHEIEVFKSKFGHCNVPKNYSDNPSLGGWCNDIKVAYKKLQNGDKSARRISPSRIDQLADIGFEWPQ